ncbi:MAG: NADH-quinone oxidoreductase subunit NuoK [Anaerolineales bacterium]|jgi:NADH-quinone oxidoreductase subunit K
MNVPTSYLIGLSGILFSLGVLGVLIRRNTIVIFMSIELMLNAANLAFISFARMMAPAVDALRGQVIVFFIIAVAAAEVAVGLALIVAIFRNKETVNIDEVNSLQG